MLRNLLINYVLKELICFNFRAQKSAGTALIMLGILLLVGGIVALLFMCKKANEYTRAQANVCWKALFLRLYLLIKTVITFYCTCKIRNMWSFAVRILGPFHTFYILRQLTIQLLFVQNFLPGLVNI